MNIKQIETYPLLYRLTKPYGDANGFKKYRSSLMIRIITTSGVEGWGECIDWLPLLEKGFQERIIPFLIGKRALDRLQLVKTIRKWHQRAAAGVSMALTEITAKHAGLSICDLWGGKWREQIPVYASFQSYWEEANWATQSLKMVDEAISQGYSQIKVKVGGKPLKEDLNHLFALQELLEHRISLAIDANQSYDLATAKEWNRYFKDWSNIIWFEEPLPLHQTVDYKHLRMNLAVPIAGGENLQTGTDYLPLIRENGLDILQPDVMHHPGIEEYRGTLQLARHFGLRLSPHAFDGALSRLYALFAQAVLPPWTKMEGDEIEPVEWDFMDNPFTNLIPLKPVYGKILLPKGVGIGVEINMDILKKFRWDGSVYR